MSRKVLNAVSVVGLVLAVVSNAATAAAFVGNGGDSYFDTADDFGLLPTLLLVIGGIVALVAGVAAAVLAGIALFGQRSVPPAIRFIVPTFAAIAAALAVYLISGAFVSSAVTSAVLSIGPAPFDWARFFTAAIAVAALLGAAAAYVLSSQRQNVGHLLGHLFLLLLSVVPAANILGLLGFVLIARRGARQATPALPAVSG